jgi:two-component system, cell cycle sensor histidine kinase and response regulator CckA
VEVLEENTGISLAILDLTMPVMTGEQALPLIRAMRPDLPILISSGFSEAELSLRFAASGIAGVLQKPYSVSTIISRAAAAINDSRSVPT